MIWAFDRAGKATYVSPEWSSLTGQSRYDAESWGWLDALHPEDRDMVRSTVGSAAREEADFTVAFRLRRAHDGYLWVVGGAAPSFSPQDSRFIGFLGSLSETATPENGTGRALVGHFHPPPPTPATPPGSPLEAIADHLLIARALAVEIGEKLLQGLIDISLLEAGQRLASTQRDGNAAGSEDVEPPG